MGRTKKDTKSPLNATPWQRLCTCQKLKLVGQKFLYVVRRFKQCIIAPLALLYSLCCPSLFKWTPSYDKYELEARQSPRCVQYMAKGSGSKTPWRYCVRICTLALKAPTGCLLTVWPTHTKRTPSSWWSKQTKSSMAEPTDAGDDRRRVRSLVPICKNTTSGLKRSTSVKSNRLTLSIVWPPTPCQWIVTEVLMFKLRLYVGLFLIIKSRSLRIKEWPKIRTLGCSIQRKGCKRTRLKNLNR